MKSKILAAGAASLALALAPVVGTFATDGVGLYTQDVTVGDVTEPIYSVSIHWGDMSYDWAYDNNTGRYGFRSKVGCSPVADGPVVEQALQDVGNFYQDTDCSVLYTGDVNDTSTTRAHRTKYIASGGITVIDSSTNGRVQAEASFTPTADYSWVIGKFGTPRSLYIEEEDMHGQMGISEYYGFLGYDPSTDSFYYDDLENNKLKVTGVHSTRNGVLYDGVLQGHLYLEVNDQVEKNNTVSSGDTIGTLTITISPDSN